MSRVLSGYIHRATLGLRGEERREIAAELRTHLLDRVRQLEAEGFGREEAEHLAVKAMGDVKVTNAELLGHFFTTPLGWAVLAVLLLGGGGYWLWRTVPLPLLGPSVKWEKGLTVDDLAFLMADEWAPRATFEAATISIPAEMQWFYLAVLPRKGVGMANIEATPLAAYPYVPKATANQTLRARVLMSGKLFEDRVCPPVNGGKQLQAYVAVRPLQASSLALGSSRTPGCTGISFVKDAQTMGWATNWQSEVSPKQRLPLNKWTVLALLKVEMVKVGGDEAKSRSPFNPHDYLLAVMPADHALHQPDPNPRAPREIGSFGVFLDGSTWQKYARGLPRPTLTR